jgi:hypothetical protein
MTVTHGLASTYRSRNGGCRCVDCCRANTERARREKANRATRTPPADAHGKASTYSNWRCRCEPCTTAHSTYLRNRRQQARETP